MVETVYDAELPDRPVSYLGMLIAPGFALSPLPGTEHVCNTAVFPPVRDRQIVDGAECPDSPWCEDFKYPLFTKKQRQLYLTALSGSGYSHKQNLFSVPVVSVFS
jgi:hypothetical protein